MDQNYPHNFDNEFGSFHGNFGGSEGASEPEKVNDADVFTSSFDDAKSSDIYPLFPLVPYDDGDKNKKEKKPKKKFSFVQLVACILATAMLCCGVVAGVMDKRMDNKLQNMISGMAAPTDSNDASISKVVYTNGENENGISAVAEKVSPSVVGIRTTGTTSNYFFGQSDSSSEGSGVIYTSDGYIITNYHVISLAVESSQNRAYSQFFGQQQGSSANRGKVEVFLNNDNQTAYEAEIVGYDASVDLAVLKIDKTGLTPIDIGDSSQLKIGDMAIAVGNPGGLEFMGSVSKGIISGLDRTITAEDGSQMNLIQTDAAINPGNSGGALCNAYGELIGINNSKMSGDGFEGMGFSIPVNTVVEVCDRIISNKDKPQPFLGISASSEYSSETLQRYGLPAGVLVAGTVSGSPAEDAGIQAYDIITEINGVAVTSYEQLNNEKNKHDSGDTITLTVFRSGDYLSINVTLGVTH